MATPITWRNVDAPDNRGVSAMLGGAQDGINSGLGQLANILKQRESVNEANWNQQKTNNTQAFLDAVGKPTTPEEFAALQQSGVLEQMRKGFGSQVDLAATRAAEEARLSTLQQRQTTNNDFLDRGIARAQQPIQEKIKTAYINGDIAGGDALVAANPGLVHPDELAKLRVSSQDEVARRTQEALMRPFIYKNQVDTAKLNGLEIQGKEQAIKEADEMRRLETRLSSAQQSYINEQQEKGKIMGRVAKELGLPVDIDGAPRIADMTEAQQTKLFHQATLAGVPEASAYGAGDTSAANRFYTSLTKSGEFSPTVLQKQRDRIRQIFDSTLLDGAVGNNAQANNRASAQTTVAMEEVARNNWSTPNSPDALRDFEAISAKVPALVGDGNQRSVQKAIYTAATKGIKTADGTYVTPSMNDVLSAIASTNDDFWSVDGWSGNNDNFGEKVTRLLEKRMQAEDATQRFKDAEEYKAWKRKSDVKKILNTGK